MASNNQIIDLYTELAENPDKDFGWDKGIENAKAHGYKKEWIETIPKKVWDFCAAVGNPFKDATIKPGNTVLDLGCGAGVDVLVASLLVGDTGKVIGVDITPKMVEASILHAKLAKRYNVSILESSFNDIDIEDESIDIVISNGAINLTSCKESVFAEIYRVLKPNGKIFFADMIDISKETKFCSTQPNSSCAGSQEEDWANCVAGTLKEDELIELIKKAGFENVICTGHTHYTTSDTTLGATFKATKTASNVFRKKHWEELFKRVDYSQVLWHQNSPKKSLELISQYANKESKIIDIGCGASFLIDYLLDNDYKNITLLDTSSTSLAIVKNRINNTGVNFVCEDILHFKTDEKLDIWHDRALFHFLLSKKERQKYFEVLSDSLREDATAIISTFRIDGPIECAGLEIIQYNHEKMSHELPNNLEIIHTQEYTHITPKESEQKYIYFLIKKR